MIESVSKTGPRAGFLFLGSADCIYITSKYLSFFGQKYSENISPDPLRACGGCGLIAAEPMASYMIHGGLGGFLLVLAINLLNGNDYGLALMRGCIAALAFAIVCRWFMRSLFSELHLAVWEHQQAAAKAAAALAEAEDGEVEEPAEEAA